MGDVVDGYYVNAVADNGKRRPGREPTLPDNALSAEELARRNNRRRRNREAARDQAGTCERGLPNRAARREQNSLHSRRDICAHSAKTGNGQIRLSRTGSQDDNVPRQWRL